MSIQSYDIGNLARWSVSSRKFGFGLQHLRDGNEETFWQSEGPQPHNIDLAFSRKVYVSAVHICLSHSNDDSYTPEKITLSLGTSHYDLVEVKALHLDKPDGWGIYALRESTRQIGEGADAIIEKEEGPPMPAFHVRIQIIANHLNGKDTHVRGIRVYGVPGTALHIVKPPPVIEPTRTKSTLKPISSEEARRAEAKRILMLGEDGLDEFTSRDFTIHRIVR